MCIWYIYRFLHMLFDITLLFLYFKTLMYKLKRGFVTFSVSDLTKSLHLIFRVNLKLFSLYRQTLNDCN